jgi:surfeit locus 1 family protein
MNEGARRGAPRKAGIGLAISAVAAFVLLCGLGTWQVQRLQWKLGLIAARQAAVDAPPLALDRPADAAGLPEYRHVRVRGTFVHKDELPVGPVGHDGVAGWRIVTPLALTGGGFVLVDRGFVPSELKSPTTRRAGQLMGPVVVEGLLRRPSPKGFFAPENDPAGRNWFRIDPPAMAKALGLGHVAPFWVAAGRSPANPGGWPRGGADVIMPRNEHLQYAITWYSLAIALVVIYVLLLRKQRKEG